MAKTTVIRLVSTLEQSGLLWATAKGYTAGPGLWRWAHPAWRSRQLPPDTQRAMSDLAAGQGETVNVYVVRHVSRVCVPQQESPHPLWHVVQIGDELPLWAGASPKVLLHNSPPSLLVRVAGSSPYGPRHVEQLLEWIEDAAARGYAVSHGEREQGLSDRCGGARPERVGGGRADAQRPDCAVRR